MPFSSNLAVSGPDSRPQR